MIKFFNSLLLIILVSVLVRPVDARTKKPEWVVNYGHSKQYSNQKFITGFGSSTGINNESREIAQDNSLTDLSRSLTVNVDSTVESQNKVTVTVVSWPTSTRALSVEISPWLTRLEVNLTLTVELSFCPPTETVTSLSPA